jgi:PEP-CTERM motif-containing protein
MSAKLLSRLVPAVVATVWFGAAQAVPFVIEGATVTTSGLSIGTSVDVKESDGLVGRNYNLTAASPTSEVFKFLDVTVSGTGAVGGLIEATMNFAEPSGADATGVFGGFAVILGWASGGFLTVLNDPGQIAFGDGGLFDVDFFGFSDSCFGCSTLSGSITAQISLLRAPRSVPEPATLSLLGAGLVAIGFARRRKRA